MKISASAFASLIVLLSLVCVTTSDAQTTQPGKVSWPFISETAIPLERMTPVASDDHAGLAFLRKPPGDGPFPAVILVHGGAPGWDEATLRNYMVHVHASRFLAAGYVVVAMTRRDLDLNLPPATEQAPVKDAVALFDQVSALPYVDPGSIVVRGTSVGGYLTLEMAIARPVAAIAVEEPFSFPFVGIRVGSDDTEIDTSKIERLDTPVLLIQGDQTPNISDFNRDVFIPAVLEKGKALEVQTYPGGLHSFAFYDSAERTPDPALSLQAFTAMESFFRTHVATAPIPLEARLVNWLPIEEARKLPDATPAATPDDRR